MPIKVADLTAKAVRELREPGRYPVGTVPGLMLWVSPAGARSWVLRTMNGAKRSDIGLGGYPGVSLADAIAQARNKKMEIKAGVDPVQKKRDERSANDSTFRNVAEKYIKINKSGWKNAKHLQQWENTLETYVYPKIGDKPVAAIETSHITPLLEEHWSTINETMVRVRNRIELVLDYAAALKLRSGKNPARWDGAVSLILPDPDKVRTRKHHKALPYKDVPGFIKALNQVEGTSAKALKFAILTAARSGEVRGAKWSEIDFDARVWEIPAERMKAGKKHYVPLTHAAITLLNAMPRFKDCDLVFPGRSLKALSDMSLLAVVRRMKVDAVPHGFRSSFRDWVGNTYPHLGVVAEKCLAHSLGNKTEKAYFRSELLEPRAKLMEDWAAYLGEPAPPCEEKATPLEKNISTDNLSQ